MSTLRVLLSAQEIEVRIKEMGAEIDRDFAGSDALCLVGVLKGSWMFLADLARSIKMPTRIEFMRASSYGESATTAGSIRLLQDLDYPIEGQDVIVVEDIVDTGLTLQFLRGLLLARKPRSLRVAALLDKPERRRCEVEADYVGFTIPDHFVVGYGLDLAEQHRSLPDVCVLEQT